MTLASLNPQRRWISCKGMPALNQAAMQVLRSVLGPIWAKVPGSTVMFGAGAASNPSSTKQRAKCAWQMLYSPLGAIERPIRSPTTKLLPGCMPLSPAARTSSQACSAALVGVSSCKIRRYLPSDFGRAARTKGV